MSCSKKEPHTKNKIKNISFPVQQNYLSDFVVLILSKPQYDINMLFENKSTIGLNIIIVQRSFLVIQLFFVFKHLLSLEINSQLSPNSDILTFVMTIIDP